MASNRYREEDEGAANLFGEAVVKLKPSVWWVSGGLWLGVLLVCWWLVGRWPEGPTGVVDYWYIAMLVSTLAWGAALGWKGGWGWAMASVVVAAVWSRLWSAVAIYTDPDPAWENGSIDFFVYLLVLNGVLIGLGAGLGAGSGALYRRLRASGLPRA